MAASPVAAAVSELQLLLALTDVPAGDDKPLLSADAVHAHLVAAADNISRSATKCAAVLPMAGVDDEGRRFVSTGLVEAAAMMVSGCQIVVRSACVTRAKEVKRFVKYEHDTAAPSLRLHAANRDAAVLVCRSIVMGCIGLLSKFGGESVAPAYLQAAGMLFELCGKVASLPKTDSVCVKRRVLKVGCAGAHSSLACHSLPTQDALAIFVAGAVHEHHEGYHCRV
jgi:hypothetical protein